MSQPTEELDALILDLGHLEADLKSLNGNMALHAPSLGAAESVAIQFLDVLWRLREVSQSVHELSDRQFWTLVGVLERKDQLGDVISGEPKPSKAAALLDGTPFA